MSRLRSTRAEKRRLDHPLAEQFKLVPDFGLVLIGEGCRIIAGEAGVAILRADVSTLRLAQRLVETFDGQESEAVGMDELLHAANVEFVREQFGALRRIDTIEAAMLGRRAGDAHMHFLRARFTHHLHDLEAGRTAHDAVVDKDDALAVDQCTVGVVLQLDTEVANLIARLDRKSVV